MYAVRLMNGKFYNKSTTTESFTRATKHLHKNAQAASLSCSSHRLPVRTRGSGQQQGDSIFWTQQDSYTYGLQALCRRPAQTQAKLSAAWRRYGHKIPPTPSGAWQWVAAAVTSQQNLKIVQKDIPVSKSHYHNVEAMDHKEMRISPGISCSHPEGELVSQKESSHQATCPNKIEAQKMVG